jgi:quinone-modifying oxidoreductase subunit QmoC
MAEQLISPDLKFVKEVMKNGGESLKKCFQCATCSVVCNVTPDNQPFPRKEMVLAQWGQKEKLFSSPDIWLCHQCSDCTAYCPRGAKPGEVLGAIRKLTLRKYSAPSFLGSMVGDAKYLILLLLVPIILFGVVAPYAAQNFIPAEFLHGHTPGYLNEAMTSSGPIVYAEKLMPVPFIDTIFGAAALFALISFVFGIRKYWTDLSSGAVQKGNLVTNIKETVLEILAHKRFQKCTVTSSRSTAHLLVFYAFIGLAITTTWAIVYLYGLHWESPYPLTDPLKIVGNASALALLVGITLVIMNRFANAEKAGLGSYYDWIFIGDVFCIMATGILSEVLRLADIAVLAYPVYFTHLVFIFFLFAYAPFSKMAHMLYRATAMVFAKQAARE